MLIKIRSQFSEQNQSIRKNCQYIRNIYIFPISGGMEVAEVMKRNVLLAGGVVLLGIISCIVILLLEQRMVKRRGHSPQAVKKKEL